MTEMSTSSFVRWLTLAKPSSLVCPTCDVSWNRLDHDECWVCGGPGSTIGELRRQQPDWPPKRAA